MCVCVLCACSNKAMVCMWCAFGVCLCVVCVVFLCYALHFRRASDPLSLCGFVCMCVCVRVWLWRVRFVCVCVSTFVCVSAVSYYNVCVCVYPLKCVFAHSKVAHDPC